MADVEKYADDLQKLSLLIREASDVTRNVCGWPIEQLVTSYKSMYDRFCPYKVGDRVMLKYAPNFDSSPGWRGKEHMLIPGALATVRGRGYYKDKFSFDVEFDTETYIYDGEVRPVSSKHTFGFTEDQLAPSPI